MSLALENEDAVIPVEAVNVENLQNDKNMKELDESQKNTEVADYKETLPKEEGGDDYNVWNPTTW